MNKRLVVKSLAAVTAVYAIAGFFGVPYVLKNVVPGYVSEGTEGGQFAVEKASFNPFTFRMSLKKMSFKTPQGGDLISVDRLVFNLDPLSYLWRGGWVIGDIALSEPKITIGRDSEGSFNFQWLTQLGGDEQKEQTPSDPLKLIIEHFGLKNGTLDYTDFADGKAYDLHVGPVGFDLEHIDLRDLSTADGKMRLYATINEGGFVDLKAKIDSLSPLILGGSVAFDSGKLYTPWRYFKEKFPIEVADGTAAFGFDYRFNSADLNSTELSKLYVGVDKLRIIPKGEERNLFTLGSLRLKEGRLLPMKKEFNASALEIDGVSVAAKRSREGKIDWLTYAEAIQKAFPSDQNETKEPWTFALSGVKLNNIGVEWSDDAPREPYRMSLNNLCASTGAIGSDEKALLNLQAQSGSIRLYRKQDNAEIAGVEKIAIEGTRIDRAGKFAQVDKIAIAQPRVALKRLSEGTIDLAHYVYASKDPVKTSAQTPWGYRIGEIDVTEGAVRFVDEVPARDVAVSSDQIHLNVKDFDNDPGRKSMITLSSRINEKSLLEITSGVVRSPLSAKGEVALRGFDVSLIDPYIEPSSYASLRRGILSLNTAYDYTPAKTSVKGKVALDDWVVNDTRDDSVLLGWESIGVTPFTYTYPANALRVNQLSIDGFYTNALIDAKKVLNFSTLSKKSSGESNTTKGGGRAFGIDIVKLLLRNSSATFSDLSLPLPFKTYIHDLEGSVMGISTTKDVKTFVKLRGGVDRYGLAKIDGSLNTKAPKRYTDIKVAFDNLELKGYTPYSLQFLGYKIEGGRLFLDLGYKIDEGKLGASNRVVIRQIELGAEKEGGSPWPMRFVVALLEDSDGVIDIDLPIEGDVNNPDFKYGKVVWQVIGNLFTKAVTSPFRLLGSLMGIESDKLSAIDFEAGSVVLTPPQIEKLDLVTTMLTKRPKLSLAIYGGWDEVHDGYALKSEQLVALAQKRVKGVKIDSVQAIPLDVLEEIAEERLEKKERKALKESFETKYTEEAAFVRHYSTALIEKLVPMQELPPQALSALGSARSAAIQTYLLKTAGLEKRLVLKGGESVKAQKPDEVPNRLEIIVP